MRRYLLDTGVAGDLIARRRGVDIRVRDTVVRGDSSVSVFRFWASCGPPWT
jgi:hypothetical protein